MNERVEFLKHRIRTGEHKVLRQGKSINLLNRVRKRRPFLDPARLPAGAQAV